MTPPLMHASNHGNRWDAGLISIDGSASNDVWVVGSGASHDGVPVPYFAHWNGTHWIPWAF